MLGECLGWLWRLQQRTSYVGSLGVELIVQAFAMPKLSLAHMNRYGMFGVETPTPK